MKPQTLWMSTAVVLTVSIILSCDSRAPVHPDAASTTMTGAAAPAPPAAAPKRRHNPAVARAALATRLHDRINRERKQRGLPTMRWDEALGRIAVKHSKDMAERNYFGHTSPEGRSPADRYLRNGYACGITVDGVLRTGGENIFRVALPSLISAAEGTREIKRPSGREIVETVVRGWLEHRADRGNILSPDWQREGIGIIMGPDDTLYVTLDLC